MGRKNRKMVEVVVEGKQQKCGGKNKEISSSEIMNWGEKRKAVR